VIYLAESLATSGAEVFGDTFAAAVCPQLFVGRVIPTALIEVQDLVGNGAMLLGASQVLAAGDNRRSDTQEWARAIYEDNPPGRPVAGIRYSGAHDSGTCLALWDRAISLDIASTRTGQPADLPLYSPDVWHHFVKAMADRSVVVTRIDAADCSSCQRNP
jgi:RES domain